MSDLACDEDGFTCVCGLRNEYPQYVKEHWGVKLAFSCSCQRKYILFHGAVVQSSADSPEIVDSEAFSD